MSKLKILTSAFCLLMIANVMKKSAKLLIAIGFCLTSLGAWAAQNVLLLSTSEIAPVAITLMQNLKSEFANAGANITHLPILETSGAVSNSTFVTASGGSYDITIIASVFKPIAASNWSVISNAIATRKSNSFIMFVDGCASCSMSYNLGVMVTVLDSLSTATITLGSANSNTFGSVLNTNTPFKNSFTSLTPLVVADVRYLNGIPGDNVLYLPQNGAAPNSTQITQAVGAFFPVSQSYGGAGACTFAVTDMSIYGATAYTSNVGKIGPAFLSAAGSGGSCGLPATISKSFDKAELNAGDTAVLTINIANTSGVSVTGLRVVDNLPSPLLVNGSASSTCTGGTLSASQGGSAINLSAATLPAAGCSISVPVIWPASSFCGISGKTVTNTITPGTVAQGGQFSTDGGQVNTVATADLKCKAQIVSLVLQKQWSSGELNDEVSIGATTGFSNNTPAFISKNLATNNTTNSATVSVAVGDVGVLPAETYTVSSNASKYTSSQWVCSDGLNPSVSVAIGSSLSIPIASNGRTMTCTLTNTFIVKSISLTKTAGIPTGQTVGSKVTYSFEVKNTGSVSLSGLSILDVKLDSAASCPVTTLAAGASTICSGTHTITQAEIDAGKIDNSATASIKDSNNNVITSSSSVSTTLDVIRGVTLTKSSNLASGVVAGSTVGYSFLVKNTGNVTLNGLSIDDPRLDAAAICPVSTLAPNASTTCTGVHTVTQAEIDAGKVDNSATVKMTDSSNVVVSSTDSVSTVLTTIKSIDFIKTAGTPSGNTAGSTIGYSFSVKNTGNITLIGLSIDDAQLDSVAVCVVAILKPGESTTCSGQHTITQAEVDAGKVLNTATATLQTPLGENVSAKASASTTLVGSKSLSFTKTAGTPSGNTVGSTIGYSFLVVNTGNVTLNSLVIVDSKLDAAAICPVSTLLSGESTTCTGTHTITQAEVDSGVVINSATATMKDALNEEVTGESNTSTTLGNAAGLNFTKAAGTPSGNTAGSTIVYTFTVKNTGNKTLSSLTINDAQLDSGASCLATSLTPGSSTTCTGTHTMTQAEVDAGQVDNHATVSMKTPDGSSVTATASTNVIVTTKASMSLTKTVGTPSGTNAGSTVNYGFLVSNTGNVTLTQLVLSDAKLDSAASCLASTLAPGASTTCTGTHTITQADIDAGQIVNTANATMKDPNSTDVVADSSISLSLLTSRGVSLSKTAGLPSGSTAGSTIAYSFTVKNTGNVSLSNLLITDTQLDSGVTCPVSVLAPGASTVCTGTHTITQAQVNAGVVNNSANVSMTDPQGNSVTGTGSASSNLSITRSLTLTKQAGTASGSQAGSTLGYTFTVKNTGNVTLNNLVVEDAKLDSAASCPVTVLLPGASTNCTGVHTITQAEINAGKIDNAAQVTMTDSTGAQVTGTGSVSSALTSLRSLQLTKTAGSASSNSVGGTIAYQFKVENTGNLTLTDLVIVDAKLDATATCPVTILLPGASTNCTGLHTITQAEVDAGQVNNTATAVMKDPSNVSVSGESSVSSTIVKGGAVSLTKTAGTPSGNVAGSTLTYSFLVKNTGNITMTNLVIDDSRLDAPAICPVSSLMPNASTTCTGQHTMTQSEIDAGQVDNTATVNMKDNSGNTISGTDSISTVLTKSPSLTLTKTAGTPSGMTAGSTIAYSFLVVNTGNVSLTGLQIVDVKLDSAASCPVTGLLPQASTVCTGTHTITQAEIDSGHVSNSASAKMVDASGVQYTAQGSVNSVLASNLSLSLTKTAGVPSGNTVGSTIVYSFLVENNSNVGLTDLVIDDIKLDAPAACPVSVLASGANTICTGTHTITQAEVDAGQVDNTASVSMKDPQGNTTTAIGNSSTVLSQTSGVELVKKTGEPSGSGAGSTISYQYVITNTGNVTLKDLVIQDPGLDGPAVCSVTVLAQGQTVTCTGTHTITQSEIDAGLFESTATAKAINPTGTEVSQQSSTPTKIVQILSAKLLKEVVPIDNPRLSDVVTYRFTVTNDGNVTLTNLVIDDPLLEQTAVCPVQTLKPQATTICEGRHVITQSEVSAGQVVNAAHAQISSPTGIVFNSNISSVTLEIPRDIQLLVTKRALVKTAKIGDFVRYEVVIENLNQSQADGFDLIDQAAPGLSYVSGSLTVIGDDSYRVSSENPLTTSGLTLAAGAKLSITYMMRVGASAGQSTLQNCAQISDVSGIYTSNRSCDEITRTIDPDFEMTRVWGTVFEDVNGNGIQEPYEQGIPGVRLATVEGLLIETDAHGRYHIEGIAPGQWARGSNFIVKVDKVTLPQGSMFTTQNPLVKRLTQGVPGLFNFGVKMP